MKDELAPRRRTRTIERFAKSIQDSAASGYEPAQNLIDSMQALLDANEDTKTSLRVFVVELRDPQVLAHYEKETGKTGVYDVVNALIPNHPDIIASVLTGD